MVEQPSLCSYYWSAWQEAKPRLGKNLRRWVPLEAAVTIGTTAFYALLVLPPWPFPHPTDEAASAYLALIAGAIVLVLLIAFTVALVVIQGPLYLAQASAQRESRLEIRTVELAEQVDILEDKRAKLAIIFEPVFPMFWKEQRWYRICVRNNSRTTQARDVLVKLISIDPLPQTAFINVCPSQLGRKDGGTDDCQINPGSEEFFDLVSESSTVSGVLHLWTVANAGQSFVLQNDIEHHFRIEASAANAEPAVEIMVLKQRMLPTDGELEVWIAGQVSTSDGLGTDQASD